MNPHTEAVLIDRREWVKLLAATGIGGSAFHRAAAALASQENELTEKNLADAAWITDFDLGEEESEKILKLVKRTNNSLKQLRQVELPASLSPAFQFNPLTPSKPCEIANREVPVTGKILKKPADEDDIAYAPILELGALLKDGKISSAELTRIYLGRLKKYGPMLRCVVNLTEDLALKQATKADQEIAAGKYRGPLHGIPWGAKDLIDVEGYPTTWGIPVHKERMPASSATVYERLTEAGAVLLGKLSLGAIALGDKWYGGKTRNPWNPSTGSSGSSAGSASASSAGLVGFSLGSETLGSITTPSKICGSTGFRPTFGRVSREGCMPLSWTMDKIGPIGRSAADCALVFAAIHGADNKDRTARTVPFDWPGKLDLSGVKIGYTPGTALEDRKELQPLKELGCEFVEVRLPITFPLFGLVEIINVEAASVFDKLLREGKTEGWNDWPNTFRSAQFVSAIDYLRFMRLRSRLMEEMQGVMTKVDFLVNVFDVFHSNLTGNPSIVFPLEYQDLDNSGKKAVPITVTGRIDDDARLLAFADIYQRKIGNAARPELDFWLDKYTAGELD